MSFSLRDEPVPDACPLTAAEKTLKAELEKVVEGGLQEFLKVGAALATLRNRRLFRTEFATFEEYVRAKFGLARSSADQLIRSAQTAQVLLEAGVELPANTTATVLRPIASLPGEELQVACWEFAQSLAPARGVTQPLIARLVRVVRNALEGAGRRDGQARWLSQRPEMLYCLTGARGSVPSSRPTVSRLATVQPRNNHLKCRPTFRRNRLSSLRQTC
jgi:hypothetical protein